MPALATTLTNPLGSTDTLNAPSIQWVGASINNFWNDIPSRLGYAVAAGLNVIRITDWLMSNKNVTNTYNDEAAWVLCDTAIAAAVFAGMKVILDLSTYRNFLAKRQNTNPYTSATWTTFLNFVAARVNTVTGVAYGADQTILFVAIAGEPTPGGEVDGSGNLMPTTSATLVSFYAFVGTLAGTLFPNARITSGGLLHYRAGSVGDTAWVDWQGIFLAMKNGLPPGRLVAAIHVYSGPDFGGAPGSGDETQLPGVASFCAANGIPWYVEESGLQQDLGLGTWVGNDGLRAALLRNIMALAYNNGAIAFLYWNDGTEIFYDSNDIPASAPLNFRGAWSAGTYNRFDGVTNGGTTWYSLTNGNTSTPNDTNSQQWGKAKTSTFDIGPQTPLAFTVVSDFARGVLRSRRQGLRRFAGGTQQQVSQFHGEFDYADDDGVIYVDDTGVPYAVGL